MPDTLVLAFSTPKICDSESFGSWQAIGEPTLTCGNLKSLPLYKRVPEVENRYEYLAFVEESNPTTKLACDDARKCFILNDRQELPFAKRVLLLCHHVIKVKNKGCFVTLITPHGDGQSFKYFCYPVRSTVLCTFIKEGLDKFIENVGYKEEFNQFLDPAIQANSAAFSASKCSCRCFKGPILHHAGGGHSVNE